MYLSHNNIKILMYATELFIIPTCMHKLNNLEYKYCDLIGHSEVSISHRDLQAFIETYKFS